MRVGQFVPDSGRAGAVGVGDAVEIRLVGVGLGVDVPEQVQSVSEGHDGFRQYPS